MLKEAGLAQERKEETMQQHEPNVLPRSQRADNIDVDIAMSVMLKRTLPNLTFLKATSNSA